VVHVGHRHIQLGGGGRHRAEQLASVDAPSGPDAGGDGARPREILTALADGGRQHDVLAVDARQRRGETVRAALRAAGERHLVAAHHVEHRDQVHVHADRDRRVAARQPARSDDHVVGALDPESAQLGRDRRDEVPRTLERVDRLEGIAAVAVVLRGSLGEFLRQLLGGGHETCAGGGVGFQLDWHR
jgi:hypothetical protein